MAADTPERITRLTVDPRYGLLEHQALRLGLALYDDLSRPGRRPGSCARSGASSRSATPRWPRSTRWPRTPAGEVVALDAKLVIDDNALFRQPELAELRDLSSEDPAEVRARTAGLSYVKLDGNIGCVVNGAGLAMATMDLIQYYGGRPANFLDIGGSSNPEKVVSAMRILLSDPNVEAVLFNIFGGITRCDDVAKGLVSALRQIDVKVPIVIRLTGTNEEEGLAILRSVDLPATNSMDEVVQRAIALARERREAVSRVSILLDATTRLVVQGITGRDGSFHTAQMIEYGTRVVAGVTPGKGGQTSHRTSPCSTRSTTAVAETGANTSVIYVPAAVRRERHPGSGRRRHPPGRGHHRGDPGQRHAPGVRLRARPRRAPGGAQLPGRHHARGLQGGDPPGPDLPARQRGCGLAQRYPDVRGGVSADGGRDRPIHLRWDRRGPDRRARASSTACALSRPTPTRGPWS